MKKNGSATFVVSLDFELLWGVIGYGPVLEGNIPKEVDANIVPRLLALFEKYGIHATWATVGAMMARDEAEFRKHLPEQLPPQTEKALKAIGFSEEALPQEKCRLVLAPDWVDQIRSTPGQEIGSHTYTHYYCDLPESAPEQLSADLSAANAIAEEKGIELQSLVFPQNQVRAEYVDAARAQGFRIYRGKETNAGTSTLFWYLNHYFPLKKCSYDPEEIKEENILNIKSSRFYKPYRRKYAPLEPLKVRRYCREVMAAAKAGEIYHIYWHPHNFAEDTEKNFAQLESLLKTFRKASETYGMQSLNMRETAEKYHFLEESL